MHRLGLAVGVGAVFLLALGAWRGHEPSENADQLRTFFQEHLNRELMKVEREAEELMSDTSQLTWATATGWFFEWNNGHLQNWTTQAFLPDYATVSTPFITRYIRVANGSFVLRKWELGPHRFFIGCLPLYQEYAVQNKYLQPKRNTSIWRSYEPILVDPVSTIGLSLDLPGNPGAIKFILPAGKRTLGWGSLCQIAGLLLLLAAGVIWVLALHRKGRVGLAWLVLLATLLLTRGYMVKSDIPQAFTQSDWFAPEVFSSSWYNRSLGDLLLNSGALVVVLAYLFRMYARLPVVQRIMRHKKTPVHLFLGAALATSGLYFSFLFPVFFVETIFHNSDIPIDVTQTLQMSPLRIGAWASIGLGCLAAFFVFHISCRLLLHGWRTARLPVLAGVLLATGLFFMFARAHVPGAWIVTGSAALLMTILLATRLSQSLGRTRPRTFVYFFLLIIGFSLQLSFSIRHYAEEERKAAQFRFADAYLSERDPLGEYLLDEARAAINADNFIVGRLSNIFLAKDPIRQKIRRFHLGSYFDQYDIDIFLYNALGEPIDEVTPVDLSDLLVFIQPQVKETHYSGIYFYTDVYTQAVRRYFCYLPVYRGESLIGFIALDLKQKRILPQRVYPALLLDDRFADYLRNADYSYVYFYQGQIVRTFGDFDYSKRFDRNWIQQPALYRSGIHAGGRLHVSVEDDSGFIKIVSGPGYTRFDQLANFSAFFIAGVALVLTGMLLLVLKSWRQRIRLGYTTRIQLFVALAFVLPLVMVSYSIQQTVSRAYDRQLKAEFTSRSKILAEQFADWYFAREEQVSTLEVADQLRDLSAVAGVDVSLFYPDGALWTSTQPQIYERLITAPLMEPGAWRSLARAGTGFLVVDEWVGTLQYNAAYIALRSPETGALAAVLSLPFFDSSRVYERSQITVLMNILIIFSLGFIFFLFLSLAASSSITFPLRLLAGTLSRTSLSGTNAPIVWKSTDEIGYLVREYNRMIENLERNKTELARIQKEQAWREIAQQVAHEIKNPLTPMKLTLQQMEAQPGWPEERTRQAIQMLLQQVHTLNEIASSFSAFARMPAPRLQRVEVNAAVGQAVRLFQLNSWADIEFRPPENELFILTDEKVLSRALSNLILNAIQSGREGQRVQIQVAIRQEGPEVVLSVTDNGSGISEEMKPKVFLPHFSTKQTGSGLGLAIVRQGIEQANGSISFDSVEGRGSVFYLRFPKAD